MSPKDKTAGLDQIQTLDGNEDWEPHRRQLDNWLIQNDYMPIIKACPTFSIDESETYQKWRRIQDKAVSAIDMTIGPSARSMVIGLDTYHDIYAKLEPFFKPRGDGAFLEYSTKLMGISLAGFSSVEEYTSEFKRLQSKLAQLSIPAILQECWAIQWYLQGLGSAYDIFRTTLSQSGNLLPTNATGTNGLAFDTIFQKAVEEEKRIQLRDSTAPNVMAALPSIEIRKSLKDRQADLPAPTPIPGETEYVMAPTMYCTHCKRLHHIEPNCHIAHPEKKKSKFKRKDNHSHGSDSKKQKDANNKPRNKWQMD